MSQMFTLLFPLLVFLSSALAYRVSVEAKGVVAGGSVKVNWARTPVIDDKNFALRLRKSPGDTNGPFTNVNPNNFQFVGETRISVPDPGEYIIEVFRSTKDSPSTSSDKFTVAPKPGAPAAPTTRTPPPPPPAETNTTPPAGPPAPSSTANGGENNGGEGDTSKANEPTATGTPAPGDQPSETSNSQGTSRDRSSASDPVFSQITVIGVDGGAGVTTIIPQTTPQVVTFLSNSRTLTSTIGPIPTSSGADQNNANASPSGGASKSNVAVIVGAVLGSLFFLIFLALIFVMYRRRKRRQATNTFFRDKMVRSQNSGGAISSVGFASNPSMTALNIPASNDNREIPYADLDEKIEDYDHSDVTVMTANRINPYAGMYESTYSGVTPKAYPTIVETPPSRPPSDDGLFYVSSKHRLPPVVPPTQSYAPGSIIPGPAPITSPSSSSPRSPLGLAAPRTDRQMDIHEKIVALQAKLISLQSWINRSSTGSSNSVKESEEVILLKKRIVGLEGMMNSSWALGRTDVVPLGYSDAP